MIMVNLTYENRHGIETVILSNDFVKAVILAGKGGDLLEFTWKPLKYNCLFRSDVPMDDFDHLNLHEKRLLHHSDHLLGGWVDALPHRGIYQNIELGQDNGGIAATLPWHCETEKNEKEVIRVRLWVDLPVFPMHVEKTFTLYEDSSSLFIEESVTNRGETEMSFTWTQHAIFDYPEDAVLEIDSDLAFKAWDHMASPGQPLEAYEADMKKAVLSNSEFVVYNHLKKGEASLTNQENQLEVRLNWDINQFPYLRSLYQDGLIGLEPGNDLFSGFKHSLQYHTYTVLKVKEKIETSFVLSYNQR